MFRLAHIVPTAYLSSTIQGPSYNRDIHMALAHLMNDEAYYQFYTQNSRGLLLLDNGLYEQSQVTEDYLLELLKDVIKHRKYNSYLPHDMLGLEIVAPDSLYDGPDTVKRSVDFVKQLRDVLPYEDFAKLRVMFVPQGSNVTEWKTCLKELVDKVPYLMPKENATIALSKLSCPKSFQSVTGSPYVSLNRIAAFAVAKTLWSGTIHLLGAGTPHEWQFYFGHEQIRSCDTSLAAQMTVRNFDNYEEAFPTIAHPGMDTHLNFDEPMEQVYKDLLEYNIRTLDSQYANSRRFYDSIKGNK